MIPVKLLGSKSEGSYDFRLISTLTKHPLLVIAAISITIVSLQAKRGICHRQIPLFVFSCSTSYPKYLSNNPFNALP